MSAPHFPGAVGLTGLDVYSWPSADGADGGAPHMHLVCTECYVVVAGRGRLQTLTFGGFAEVPLQQGDVVWFPPGTIHRSVNDADLRVVAVMQNDGLPEAGDAVMTFTAERLVDATRYSDAASIAGPDGSPSEELARARRDNALEGFAALRASVERGETHALLDFHRSAARIVGSRLDAWGELISAGPLADVRLSMSRLESLRAGDVGYLAAAAASRIPAPADRAFGMCGRLTTYSPLREDGRGVETYPPAARR